MLIRAIAVVMLVLITQSAVLAEQYAVTAPSLEHISSVEIWHLTNDVDFINPLAPALFQRIAREPHTHVERVIFSDGRSRALAKAIINHMTKLASPWPDLETRWELSFLDDTNSVVLDIFISDDATAGQFNGSGVSFDGHVGRFLNELFGPLESAWGDVI